MVSPEEEGLIMFWDNENYKPGTPYDSLYAAARRVFNDSVLGLETDPVDETLFFGRTSKFIDSANDEDIAATLAAYVEPGKQRNNILEETRELRKQRRREKLEDAGFSQALF